MRLKEGKYAIWKPKDWDGERWVDNGEHPWYGHKVIILQAPVKGCAYPLYQIRPVDAPQVNDPHAFDFWEVEERLIPVK